MDGDGRENRRHRVDYYKLPPWNVISHYQTKEQNSFHMNAKIGMLKDAAVRERDRAVAEKKAALDERDLAIKQRDAAITERDSAVRERDNAIAALQFQESTMMNALPGGGGGARGPNRTIHHPPKRSRTAKTNKDVKIKKSIRYDESTMPVPVCSCTGVARQCYKWGNGGWQSSCCTTSLSVYPLPQMPNKRHARMGGRKMSGSVFSRLVTRVAAGGDDLSVPIDLKNYWAKHGTNRYITIK